MSFKLLFNVHPYTGYIPVLDLVESNFRAKNDIVVTSYLIDELFKYDEEVKKLRDGA